MQLTYRHLLAMTVLVAAPVASARTVRAER